MFALKSFSVIGFWGFHDPMTRCCAKKKALLFDFIVDLVKCG